MLAALITRSQTAELSEYLPPPPHTVRDIRNGDPSCIILGWGNAMGAVTVAREGSGRGDFLFAMMESEFPPLA